MTTLRLEFRVWMRRPSFRNGPDARSMDARARIRHGVARRRIVVERTLDLEVDLLTFSGRPFPTEPERLSELTDSSDLLDDAEALRVRARRYVFLQGFHGPTWCSTFGANSCSNATVGEVDDRHPLMDAIEGDRAGLRHVNMRTFTESLRTGALTSR